MRLTVEALSCRRGERLLFADVSFSLGEGEALLVTGPNGAGKSSLLRILAGLLSPGGGRVSMTGGKADAELCETLHCIGHKDALKAALSARETLRFWQAMLLGAGQESRLIEEAPLIEEALERLDLTRIADLPTGYFSAGQRRRLALARLIVAPRPLWLLDEPSTALDAQGQSVLNAMVAAHRAQGGLVIAATHQPLDWPDARSLRIKRPHADRMTSL